LTITAGTKRLIAYALIAAAPLWILPFSGLNNIGAFLMK
jgi:hypothetical protein